MELALNQQAGGNKGDERLIPDESSPNVLVTKTSLITGTHFSQTPFDDIDVRTTNFLDNIGLYCASRNFKTCNLDLLINRFRVEVPVGAPVDLAPIRTRPCIFVIGFT